MAEVPQQRHGTRADDEVSYQSDLEVLSDVDDTVSLNESLTEPEASSNDDSVRSRQEQQSSVDGSVATQATKAIEAAEDRTSLRDQAGQIQHARGEASSSFPLPDEATPLLDAGPAPPDYAAATAWRHSNASAWHAQAPSTPLEG
jgi:hypothetical protein